MRSAIPFNTRCVASRSRPALDACEAALERARDLADDFAIPADQRIPILDRMAAETSDPSLKNAFQAYRKSITDKRFANWSELILYCHFATAPVVREMRALLRHADDAPENALWPAHFCVAALILDLIVDCKVDYVKRDRVFLPADWLREAGVESAALGAEAASLGLRKVIDHVLQRARGMLDDAHDGARGVGERRFRYAALTGIAHRRTLASKLCQRDPLAGQIALNQVERLYCAARVRFGR